MSGFAYGGVIISNGDIGLHGNSDAVQALSNNHGGIAQIRDEYYIFYHRSTNGTEFSRQGCAEKIEILPDGSIQQVEVTSCGLNGGPLTASGSYPASIACRITSPRMPEKICYPNDTYQQAARITQRQNVSLITDIQDGTVLGYKYFHYGDPFQLLLEISGTWNGSIMIANDPEGRISFGEMEFHIQDPCWTGIRVPCRPDPGDHGLYMIFRGTGTLEMKQFTFLVL